MLAVPVAAFAGFSPAQAATVTFNGFTGAFAATNWTFSGSGSGSITPTLLSIKSPVGPTSTPTTGKFSFNTAILGHYSPNPGFYEFVSGKIDKVKLQTSNFDFVVENVDNSLITFQLLNDPSTSPLYGDGEGRATGFQYTATYREVPGPLPVAAAVGAFAWSRTIRRRLSSASQA